MSKPVIKVGLVGASVTRDPGGSGFAVRGHVPALQGVAGVKLSALCTRSRVSAQASAEAFGASHFYDDFGAMLESDVDLAVICVRVPWHRALIDMALDAKKPVLCEWPLVTGLSEARGVLERCGPAPGVPTFVGLQARSDPVLRQVRSLLRRGSIGELLVASSTAYWPSRSRRPSARMWQRDPENGANTLTIAGGHTLDALRYLVGDIVSVSARLATRTNVWEEEESGRRVNVRAPDCVSVSGVASGGAHVSVQVAAAPVEASETRIDLIGSEGRLRLLTGHAQHGPYRAFIGPAFGRLVPVSYEERSPLVLPPGAHPSATNVAYAYRRIVEHWGTSDDGGGSGLPSFRTAVELHQLIAAVQQSDREGRSVTLSESA